MLQENLDASREETKKKLNQEIYFVLWMFFLGQI